MNKMVSVASRFQYSVNIGYDLGNEEKLRNFIPTKSALELLEDILRSTSPMSTDRARVLIGAYGKGKSHIVLTILSMLMKKDLCLFEKLLPKIKDNPRLLQLVSNYYESDNKILPVVISGSNTSLTQAFLLSLQRTLASFDLLKLLPETNYHAAVSVILRWEKDFPDTYNSFKSSLDEPVSTFVERLNNFDVSAYETFEKAYPQLTSGSIFNPFLGFDVVELYESVVKSLGSEGYTGIYVVYDEFSKFLEANITDASVSDTKMLQDFAEKCNRSGALQLHLMLISHKEISNYIDKLPKQKVDGWRGVSERFKHIHLNNNFTQTYEIISTVIQHKEPEWTKYCESHRGDFDALFGRYSKHQMFVDAAGDLNTAIIGCYPLHPVSTFILPRLSERVAQNERTLFTFLSAEGTATLASFLNSCDDEFRLLTPDLIYDYFEPLFKKEAYAGDIHSTYVLTSSILAQLPENTLCTKIIKTISLIYILEQFERLSPTKEQIVGIFSSAYPVEEIEHSISDLIEKELVIYVKRSNDFLQLKRTSGVDIWQKIRDLTERQASKNRVKDILNASNFDNYMYPARYNDEHEMTRFFEFCFIDEDEINGDVDWYIKSKAIDADGVIFGIVPKSENNTESIKTTLVKASEGLKQIVFVTLKHYKSIHEIIREFAAVVDLRDQAANDPILFDEYEVVFEDLQEVIKEFIGRFTHPEKNSAVYIYDGQVKDIHRKSALTELMSSICDEVFYATPIINNESVNKKEITSIALTSRNKIIGALLRGELEPNLGLIGNGQEVSIMRSTLVRPGIWYEANGVAELRMTPDDENMRNLLSVIEGFFLKARQHGPVSFSELYDLLTSPEHHIGLRKGLIPIYIAVVLHKYRKQTVICDRVGPISTSVDTLLQINATPETYTLEYLDWNPEKENYIKQLAEAFSDYIVEAEKSGNSYDYVAAAMRRWYMALPKYTKDSRTRPGGKTIVKRQIDLLKLLRQNVGASDLLFKRLPELFGYTGEFTSDVAEDVINAKNSIDGLIDDLKEFLVTGTKQCFSGNTTPDDGGKATLTSVVFEWCELLDTKIYEQLFPDGTDRFLLLLRNAGNDEYELISRLGKLATGLRLEDWDDKTSITYFATIDRFITTARDFHSSVVAETINDTASYQITFSDDVGQKTTRRFEKVDVSSRGKLLFNQINSALDAMGHAISEQEKRQSLMEILKKLC